ncbi:MAG: fatty acid desaturase [Gemmatimonadota bacterium]
MADFVRVTGREPHFERTKLLLANHPEAKALVGNAPVTAVAVFGIVAIQLAIAFLLRDSAWWVILLSGYLLGAFADHALWTLIHECTHNLVFRKSSENSWLQIAANLPIILPGAIAFRRYHILHHNHQGDSELDADLPSPREARLVGNSTIRKIVWLALYFVAQISRVPMLHRVKLIDGWYAANILVQAAFIAAVVYAWGWASLIYLLLSSILAIGLHPVGARWIQEHFLTHPGGQETFSYYGPLNAIAFNVGYHNEHHDLMRVPWMHLPRIRRMAPELYDPLHHHTSWTRLLFRFLFDPTLGLHSRVVRQPAPKGAEQRVAAELETLVFQP